MPSFYFAFLQTVNLGNRLNLMLLQIIKDLLVQSLQSCLTNLLLLGEIEKKLQSLQEHPSTQSLRLIILRGTNE